MSRAEMEKTIRDLYSARLNNNLEKTLNYFAMDSRFIIKGSVMLDVSMRPAIDRMLAELYEAWIWMQQDILRIVIDGDNAAVHYRLKVCFTPTGEILETEICDLLTFRAGKLAQLVEFIDTATADRAIGQLQEAGQAASTVQRR